MKKNISLAILLFAIIMIILFPSCNQHQSDESKIHYTSSFEFDPENGLDTINYMVNGLKQGKWIEKKNGKKETVFYKNDTIIK